MAEPPVQPNSPQSPLNVSGSTLEKSEVGDDTESPASGTNTENADELMKEGKVVIFFKHAGNVPQMKQKKFKFSITTKFQGIIDWLRKQLQLQREDPLYVFVNASFQPSPDEVLADLFRCFHQGPKLVVNYSNTPAWG